MSANATESKPADLAALADRGWPALETIDVGGWLARFAGGVTKRANSVWPRGSVADVDASIARVEALYAERGIRPAFQLVDGTDAALEGVLRDRGYQAVDDTLVMTRRAAAPHAAPRNDSGHIVTARAECVTKCPESMEGDVASDAFIRVDDEPDDRWLDVWWAVDGRGGDAERDVARQIVTSGPALYATVSDTHGAACVGRLALVDDWGGLYALATRADARRRGYARAVITGLIDAAAKRGVHSLWLQVLADNAAALALYGSLGFAPEGGYRYLIAPPQY